MDCPFLPPPAQIASAGQLNKIKQVICNDATNLRGDKVLNGPTLFSRVNHTGSSYSVVACQFNFFHLVSQMIRHKLTNSANRKGIE